MKYIIYNNQVMIMREGETYVEKVHHCMLFNAIKISETETEFNYQVIKFDINLGEYVECFEDGMEVEIDGKFYTPINGLITIPKQT